MADNPSEREEPMETTENTMDLPEDGLISESLSGLPDVPVPSTLLPNVMFRVYERHYRDQINWKFVGVIGTLLLALAVGFFAWDVVLYQKAQGLGSFSEALSHKGDLIYADIDAVFSSLTGLLKATWQIVAASLDVYLGGVPVFAQILIAMGLLILAFFTLKWLSGQVSK